MTMTDSALNILRTALLPLRRPHQVIDELPVPGHFLSRQALDFAEAVLDAHHVGAVLRVDVLDDLRDPEGQLALLTTFARVDEIFDVP
jgi:hypothetical protein